MRLWYKKFYANFKQIINDFKTKFIALIKNKLKCYTFILITY